MAMKESVEALLKPRTKDLGGFDVHRILPGYPIKKVGTFVFFDHMGPTTFAPGAGMDVRPHPHIGLATVTYLFEGTITHRDSIGSVQDISPCDVNWMTAGAGIVHSERTSAQERIVGTRLDGIQTWVGLPKAHERSAPAFGHRSTIDVAGDNRARRHDNGYRGPILWTASSYAHLKRNVLRCRGNGVRRHLHLPG